MFQDRLNGLTFLSIKNDLLAKLYYKCLINNFASRKTASKFMVNLLFFVKLKCLIFLTCLKPPQILSYFQAYRNFRLTN